MSIVTPPMLSAIHDSELEQNSPSNEETLQKLIANHNFLGDLFPVGAITFVNTGQSGVADLDADVWQQCDGSLITHELSPLRTISPWNRSTPLIDDKILRGCNGATDENSSGGSYDSDATNMVHTHTVSEYCAPEPLAEGDDHGGVWNCHVHTAGDSDPVTIANVPRWIKLVAYMRIN